MTLKSTHFKAHLLQLNQKKDSIFLKKIATFSAPYSFPTPRCTENLKLFFQNLNYVPQTFENQLLW